MTINIGNNGSVVLDDRSETAGPIEPGDALTDIRDEQLKLIFRALVILGSVALLLSAWRNSIFGWHPTFFINVVVFLGVLGCFLLENRLSFRIRAIVLLSLSLVLGVVALVTWGLMAMAFMGLFVFCMLAALLFGLRAGVAATGVAVIAIAAIGKGVHMGLIRFHFDVAAFMVAPISWAQAVSGLMLTVGIVVVALGRLNRRLVDMIQQMDRRNLQLREANERLMAEIQERDRVEKERRSLEDRLQLAQKMEALGILSGSVAHDLNNVLMGVVSYPDLLLMQLPEDSPMRKMVSVIRNSGMKAAAMVQEMLAMTRRGLASGEVVNLDMILGDFMMSPEMEKIKKFHPDVSFSISMDGGLENINGSSFHLMRVIMNLVSNGAEAMPAGGELVVRTENRLLEQSLEALESIPPGRYATLVVSDTGTGIHSSQVERIFEPFYTKKKLGRSGTGLGMAVVWNVVKDHGGFIDVQTSQGGGTTFTLFFPATTAALTKTDTPCLSQYMGNGESVLVVDDAAEMREIACNMIASLGYEAHAVPSGEAAVRYLKSHRADLVILDMIMGQGMDGLETFKRLRTVRRDQKALITSGFGETERVAEAKALGAGGFLKKPYLVEDLARVMRTILYDGGSGD
ncbi:ATP-binding protein [Desulfatitalea alkaliphila]|uniref:histidine kinase n=1 Tax=Desulfatitalea alkaliphila TaxID=2929485 RepID=A0AA41RE05_9BACT|nr:ATP-binding protein [Desulfatitalea alkaliphila]MCJ8503048.1 response regulator [Desulfatitalea alkaliphila]